jgi:FlaA1/EpsC-like NDP-sugar epimerase
MVQADTYFQIKGYDAAYDGQNKSIERRYLQNSDRIQADIVVLRHVLEHIPQPYEFLSMLKIIFGRAKIYIEVPNYDWIVSNKTFFDITYEHINYFSQNALRKLFESTSRAHGVLFDEQYQYVISDISSLNVDFDLCYKSEDWKFVSFNELFPNMQCDIRRFEELSRSNAVFLWGAATKGCLFLAHCKNQRQLLDKVKFAIDQNPQKIGKYLPGSHVEIKSKHEFFATAKSGDLLLISNPAYKDEILAEIKAADLREIRSEVL